MVQIYLLFFLSLHSKPDSGNRFIIIIGLAFADIIDFIH